MKHEGCFDSGTDEEVGIRSGGSGSLVLSGTFIFQQVPSAAAAVVQLCSGARVMTEV